MTGDWFVYVNMTMNAGAALLYLYQGAGYKSLYWVAAFTLNLCVLKGMR